MKFAPFCFLLILCIVANAQKKKPFGPSEHISEKNVFYLELLGGGILPTMKYEGTNYDTYKSDRFTAQTEGIGFRIQSTKMFSYGALISYRSQGVSFPDQNKYLLHTNYLNAFVPVEVGWPLSKSKRKATPMVLAFAGPYAAYFLNGNTDINGNESPITLSEIAQWDAGVEAGIGLRIPTFSVQGKSDLGLKVSYYYGLVNSFPETVDNIPSENLDSHLLSGTGSRFNRGIRLTISYSMSFGSKNPQTFTAGGNGKSTYKRFLNIH